MKKSLKQSKLAELLKKVEVILDDADKREQKLYNDVYQTVKMLNRKGDRSMEVEIVSDSFEQKCKAFDLTKREIEITRLLLQGKPNKAIAGLSFITVKTVETHVRNIYEKVGVANKIELSNMFR